MSYRLLAGPSRRDSPALYDSEETETDEEEDRLPEDKVCGVTTVLIYLSLYVELLLFVQKYAQFHSLVMGDNEGVVGRPSKKPLTSEQVLLKRRRIFSAIAKKEIPKVTEGESL